MGTTGLTAQAYGRSASGGTIVKKNLGQENILDSGEVNSPLTSAEGETIQILTRAGLVALVLSLLLLVLQFPIAELSFWLLNGNDELEALAKEYFYIRIWAAPATIGLYALMGWYFGMQNALYPMYLTILINIVNIVFDYVLVFHFDMKADGVAWATVIAQYSGLVVGIFIWFYKYGNLRQFFNLTIVREISGFKHFFTVNRDIFFRTLLLVTAFAFFTDRSALQGTTILAVNSILLQFFFWMSYGVDGFAYASESLVGKYVGIGNSYNVHKSIRYCFYWGMGFAGLYALIYSVFGYEILTIFTNQSDIIEQAVPYLFWIVLIAILAAPSFIWDGVYIGLTASREMRDSMVISFLIYIASYYFFIQFWPNHGLWIAMSLFMLTRGIVQTVWWQRMKLRY